MHWFGIATDWSADACKSTIVVTVAKVFDNPIACSCGLLPLRHPRGVAVQKLAARKVLIFAVLGKRKICIARIIDIVRITITTASGVIRAHLTIHTSISITHVALTASTITVADSD